MNESSRNNGNSVINTSSQHFELKKVKPLTPNQQQVFDDYRDGQNIIMHGYAGTGKTYIALALALKDVIDNNDVYEKVIIIRSVVPSRDVGFLPGSYKDKIRIFEEPYQDICNELFSRGNGYEVLKTKKFLDFTTTSYLRGLTFNNAIVILDEAQNLSQPEIATVITRLGDNSKLIVCGDFRQTDLKFESEKSGIKHFLKIAEKMPSFSTTEFGIEDIVRSGICKEWIIAEAEYKDKHGLS